MPNAPAPRELRREISRSVAVVADTHIGSRYAIFDPYYKSQDGTNLGKAMNKAQTILYAHFQNFLDVCHEFMVDSVMMSGDILSGSNPKKFGYQNLTPVLDEQVEAAEMLFKPICGDRDIIIIEGTEYHGSRDMEIHEKLAVRLRHHTRSCAWEGYVSNTILNPGNKKMNTIHGAGGALLYREARLGREINNFKIAFAEDKLARYDILIRGHWHEYLHVDSRKVHAISIPAWQCFYPYKKSLEGYPKFQPDIGGVILLVDKLDRIMILHFLYPCPQIVGKLRRW